MAIGQRLQIASLVTASALGLIARDAGAGQVVKQIHPAGGGAGGPYAIAVLSDHYGARPADQSSFDSDAANLLVSDLLLDPNYAALGGRFTVRTIYDPWPSSDPKRPPLGSSSNYGFEPTAAGNCEVGDSPGTAAAVENIAASASPTRINVIGNYRFASGCTKDNWTYVYAGVFGQSVMAHEFGHLVGGLFDEYVTHPGPDPDAPIDYLNCSTTINAPWWTSLGLAGVLNKEGCHTYASAIVRPFDTCLMGRSSLFCALCRRLMDGALAPGRVTAPGTPTNLRVIKVRHVDQSAAASRQAPPVPSVRVLLSIDREAGTVQVQTVNDVTGPVAEPQWRSGEYLYEIREGNRTLSFGTVAGNPFEIRSYQGSPPHNTRRADTTAVTVTIPRLSKEALRVRAVEIVFYRLTAPSSPSIVTPAEFNRLKREGSLRRVAALSPESLRQAVR